MSVLLAEGLEKKFKAAKSFEIIFKKINLRLESGDIFCLLGANGSGKTTLLRTLLGIYPPDSGKTLFFGKPLCDEIKNKIGYLEDQVPAFPFLTVKGYLDLSLRLFGYGAGERKQKAERALERVGLLKFHSKSLSVLSRGMSRRLGLAQVICHDPGLLILDEPVEGLDLEGLVFFRKYLAECRDQKKTVLLTTHLFSEIREFSNRAAILQDGELTEDPALIHECFARITERLVPGRNAAQ